MSYLSGKNLLPHVYKVSVAQSIICRNWCILFIDGLCSSRSRKSDASHLQSDPIVPELEGIIHIINKESSCSVIPPRFEVVTRLTRTNELDGLPFNIGAWNGDIVTVESNGETSGSGLMESHSSHTGQNGLLLVQILRLVEEEVGSQLLVLVAREVGLND
jgi:hypothetical protein